MVVLPSQSSNVERQLAARISVKPEELRNYLYDVIEERLWRGRETERVTGFTFKRGSHSGGYVRDPEGTDILPPGVEPPPSG